MNFRKATLDDAVDIARIHSDSWRHTYRRVLTKSYLEDVVPVERLENWNNLLANPKPNQFIMVAEDIGEISGFVCVSEGENAEWGSYLDNLHVRKEHHARGIGKSLLTQAARWCYQQNSDNGMCLLVNQDNLHAQHFYLRLGARNAEPSVWNAPDGSVVPTFWFVWDDLAALVTNG